MNKTVKNFNLHLEKASGNNSFIASVKDENNTVLASNGFRYEISASILTMLEDSMGANVKENVFEIFRRPLIKRNITSFTSQATASIPARRASATCSLRMTSEAQCAWTMIQ